MTRFLLAGAAALGLMTGAGMAQTSTTQTTTIMSTPQAPAKITWTNQRSVTKEGVDTLAKSAIAKDSTGNVAGTTVSSTTYPLSNMIATTTKKIETVNGVPVETETTTYAYPSGAAIAPITKTSQMVRTDLK